VGQDKRDEPEGAPPAKPGGIHFGDHAQVHGDVFSGDKREVNTGGGDYHEGAMSVGGDYVGGNKTVTQNAGGDIVGRDKITTTTTTTSGLSADQVQKLIEAFGKIQKQIDARPDDPKADKDEIKDTVKRLEAEAQKGEAANPDKVGRLLTNLAAMADDIFQVTVATLANPVAGIAKVIQLVAQKAKEEQKK
jgi:hypothetical protein